MFKYRDDKLHLKPIVAMPFLLLYNCRQLMPNGENRLITPDVIANTIEYKSGIPPDLFEAGILAALFNENLVKRILTGDTPCLVKFDEVTGQMVLEPIFTTEQLESLRTRLAIESGQQPPTAEILREVLAIDSLPEPDHEEILFESGDIALTSSDYSLPNHHVGSLGIPIEDVFGNLPQAD